MNHDKAPFIQYSNIVRTMLNNTYMQYVRDSLFLYCVLKNFFVIPQVSTLMFLL